MKSKGGSAMKTKPKNESHSRKTIGDVLQGRLEEVGHLPEPLRLKVLAWFDKVMNTNILLRSISEIDDKKLVPKDDFPGGPIAWFAALSEITGNSSPELSFAILSEALKSTGIPFSAIVATMMELSPRDSTELMLATQLIVLHHQAMMMTQRTVLEGQTVDGVNFNINRSDKLLRAFRETLAALQKYRGQGVQQRVVVEHFHVHQGGKAIVGVVEAGGEGARSKNARTTTRTQQALEPCKRETAHEFPKREAVWCENAHDGDTLPDASDEERPL